MKITTVVGARPQFIKAAAVSRALKEYAIQETLIHTGQHFDENMSEVFFREMDIPKPDYHLGVGGCSHGSMTGRMLEGIEEIVLKEKPDWVLVYGDTNSTLAGALAAVKLHIPVAHVEAGLRSFNRKMPEEINRVLTDHSADLLFTPAKQATKQLLSEGIDKERIAEVGDVMYDATLYYKSKRTEGSHSFPKEKYALATIHRAENTDDPDRLREIFYGLLEVAQSCPVVIPLHPRTKQALKKLNLLQKVTEELQVIDPVGYLEMIHLESNAKVILTDSGGVQKEAYYFQVPCLTLRTETEWMELIEYGFNTLVPLKKGAIVDAFHDFSKKDIDWTRRLYGEGNSGNLIAERLQNFGVR